MFAAALRAYPTGCPKPVHEATKRRTEFDPHIGQQKNYVKDAGQRGIGLTAELSSVGSWCVAVTAWQPDGFPDARTPVPPG